MKILTLILVTLALSLSVSAMPFKAANAVTTYKAINNRPALSFTPFEFGAGVQVPATDLQSSNWHAFKVSTWAPLTAGIPLNDPSIETLELKLMSTLVSMEEGPRVGFAIGLKGFGDVGVVRKLGSDGSAAVYISTSDLLNTAARFLGSNVTWWTGELIE